MIPTIETILEDLLAGKVEKWQAVEALERHIEIASWSLRDEFAAYALVAIGNSVPEGYISDDYARVRAEEAYRRADAMLKARAG